MPSSQALADAQKKMADYAMALDLLGKLTQPLTEPKVIENILQLFMMLFAPGKLFYVPVKDGEPGAPQSPRASSPDELEWKALLDDFDASVSTLSPARPWIDRGNGFILKISHGDKSLAFVVVEEIAFPKYKEHYLNLALLIVDVCGLAINNARTYQRMREAESQLQSYTQHLEQLVAEKIHELELERAKMIQTAKLASLGEMATGVAHELNQPLAAILFEADYLKTITKKSQTTQDQIFILDTEEIYQIGENIAGDIERCRRVINHLRTFGRATRGYSSTIDLNQPLSDCFILVGERLEQKNIHVEKRLTPELKILANVTRLEQVFLNLISNAEYAMEEKERRIKSGEIKDKAYQKQLQVSTYAQGKWAVATVQDNGCGIPEHKQEQVFEPFFTTKPVGQGTGPGLSVGYGIVAEFGGEISFESIENEGTIFTLKFPLLATEETL